MVVHCHVCASSRMRPVGEPRAKLKPVSSDTRIVAGELKYATCEDCGVLQKVVDSQWRADVARLYDEYDLNFQGGGAEPYIFNSAFGSGPRAEILLKYLRQTIQLGERGSLLDVGCANGNILRSFHDAFPGWDLFGLENSTRWRDEVAALPGVKGFYEDCRALPDWKYDLIVMSHVLEHVPQPTEFLRALGARLAPNGTCLIAVPNIRENPIDLFVLDHCSHFDRDTLSRLLGRAGLAGNVSASVLNKELIVVANAAEPGAQSHAPDCDVPKLDDLCEEYFRIALEMRDRALDLSRRASSFGLMGSSTAAAWLTAELVDGIDFYVDEDPHRIGANLFGKPIVGLADIPQGSTVFMPMAGTVAEKIVGRAAAGQVNFESLPWNQVPPFTHARHRCNLCGGSTFYDYLNLGHMPIAHNLSRNACNEYRHPFRMVTCRECGLLQMSEAVPSDKLYFEVDSYLTGFQQPQHLGDLISTAISYRDPGAVLDIGCNDGVLMDSLRSYGYPRPVGIEPNLPALKAARAKGNEVYEGVLDAAMVERLVAAHGMFDAIYVRHVVEHVSDLRSFFCHVRALLKDDGLLVSELPQIEPCLEQGNPAFLWEEHVNYFTEAAAEDILGLFGFVLLDRRRYVFGGGAIASIASKGPLPAQQGRHRLRCYHDPLIAEFPSKLASYRRALSALLDEARTLGYTVLVYGAAPRSCNIVNGCRIADRIDVVIDDRVEIQHYLMPGVGKPILPRATGLARVGDKVLCLLGVGAEKEFVVARNLRSEYAETLVCVSLFPQRDTIRSIESARQAINAKAVAPARQR